MGSVLVITPPEGAVRDRLDSVQVIRTRFDARVVEHHGCPFYGWEVNSISIAIHTMAWFAQAYLRVPSPV